MTNPMSLWKKILVISFLVLIIAAAVILIIKFSSKTDATGNKNIATVSFGPLSSNLSSNGVIQKISTDIDVPLAVALDEGKIDSGSETATRSLLQAFINNNEDEPLLYRVEYVNEKYADKTYTVTSSDPDEVIMTLKPVTIDYTEAALARETDFHNGFTNAETLLDYFIDRDTGYLKVQNFADTYVTEETDTSKWVSITTGDLTDRLKGSIKHIDTFSYTLSAISANEDDYLKINDNVMHIAFEEWFTVFSLSEYDVSPINSRMNNGEKVYASVGINALNANKVVAEITEIKTGSNVSGVSYFSLYARLVFPKIETNEDGNEVGNYSYYSDDLDEKTVENLGIDLTKNVQKEELLSNYSVTITAQKTVVNDKLIVPTKCIYYNDTKEPYVLTVDAENKETRVYIEIILSTGKDAAVSPVSGYNLKEGDAIRYTAEESLLSSLF